MESDTPSGVNPVELTIPSLAAYPRVAAWLFDDGDPENLFTIPVSDIGRVRFSLFSYTISRAALRSPGCL